MASQLRIAEPATDLVVGVAGGGIQRMAWEKSRTIGLAVTGAMALGGALATAFNVGAGNPMLSDGLRGITASGFTVAGWVGAERLILGKTRSATASDGVGGAWARGHLANGVRGARASYPSPDREQEFAGVRLT